MAMMRSTRMTAIFGAAALCLLALLAPRGCDASGVRLGARAGVTLYDRDGRAHTFRSRTEAKRAGLLVGHYPDLDSCHASCLAANGCGSLPCICGCCDDTGDVNDGCHCYSCGPLGQPVTQYTLHHPKALEEPQTCSGSKQMCGGMFGDVTRLDAGRKAEEERRKAEESKRIAEAELKATERSLEEAKKAKEAADKAAEAESIEDGNLKEKTDELTKEVDKVKHERDDAQTELERLHRENQQLRDQVVTTSKENAEKDKLITEQSKVSEQQKLSINAKDAQVKEMKIKQTLAGDKTEATSGTAPQ